MEMGQDAAGQGLGEGSRLGEMLHAAARGAVGAMAMTGMRVITTELGLVEQTPPQAIARQRSRARPAAPGPAKAAPGANRDRSLGLRRRWRRGVRSAAQRASPSPLGRPSVWAGGVAGLRDGDCARAGPQPVKARALGRPLGARRRPPALWPGVIGGAPARARLVQRPAPASLPFCLVAQPGRGSFGSSTEGR
jgi:hypothetical protein